MSHYRDFDDKDRTENVTEQRIDGRYKDSLLVVYILVYFSFIFLLIIA